jgi:hypothetical protein
MDIYQSIRKLASSIRFQNLFLAAKELHGIYLFENQRDFSNLQEIFLNYLYIYDSINKDLALKKISKHIFDDTLYEDSYLLWRKENIGKEELQDNKQSDVHLVSSDKIIFPKKEVN